MNDASSEFEIPEAVLFSSILIEVGREMCHCTFKFIDLLKPTHQSRFLKKKFY